ncbi:DNA-binding protein WhiA [Aceticella autotrophica]|uniref:Probable cell division protein WhiA n=1 Tax=Aceticella autotrophica TaxID=2755338 RepID=A0A975AXF5_9THEO|nr:DNA-binding protein WhiA [Aceticella autotrophica]QSZ28143.1 DNA-binding protein WhiA [Aceticella autotrophica]
MSFSSVTKNELSKIYPPDICCKIAELAALTRSIGTISIYGHQRMSLSFITENASVARLIFKLIKDIFGITSEVMVKRNSHFKKSLSYLILIPEKSYAETILKVVKILNNGEDGIKLNYGIDKDIIKYKCCKRAYLRGVFLGGGSLSDPEKGYHLEFITQNIAHAKDLKGLINSYHLHSKIIARKNNYVVYLKEGENIVDILNIIGAHKSLLNFENIRVFKDMRNKVNRLVNCETANLTKTINASIRQIENIDYIKQTVGLNNLPDSLKEIAEIRLKYPDISLKELGQMLVPPVGKSGVNHRLRKIEEIALKIKERRLKS